MRCGNSISIIFDGVKKLALWSGSVDISNEKENKNGKCRNERNPGKHGKVTLKRKKKFIHLAIYLCKTTINSFFKQMKRQQNDNKDKQQ